MKSAYDKLQDEFGKDKVHFGNPVPFGKRPAQLGLTEITDAVEAVVSGIRDSRPDLKSTAALRCYALRNFLNHGDMVYIKTATGMGHARFWSKRASMAITTLRKISSDG